MFRRRRFRSRGPRRVARQYRSWELLCCDSTLITDTQSAGILFTMNDALQTNFIVGPAVGSPPLVTGQVFQQSIFQQGFWAFTPLFGPELMDRHGEDVTIKALYGYACPLHVTLTNTGDPFNVGRPATVRLAIIEMELAQAMEARGFPQAFPRIDLFNGTDLRRRIWWMRDWVVPTGDFDFTFWKQSITADDAKGQGNEPLLGGLMGGPRIRLPRFNFKVSRNRIPVLACGVSGPLGVTIDAVAGFSGLSKLTPNQSLSVRVLPFIRAFLVR